MQFQACEARKTAVYLGVNEDFEGERNDKIHFLFNLYLVVSYQSYQFLEVVILSVTKDLEVY